MGEEGGKPSFPLNAFLRSTEGCFLLTVLEEGAGERSLTGDADSRGLPLGCWGEFFSSHEAFGVIVTDIVVRRG